jgi:recyclin-1
MSIGSKKLTFELLPKGVVARISFYLSLEDLLVLGRVSKQCRELSLIDSVWATKAVLLGIENKTIDKKEAITSMLKKGLAEVNENSTKISSIEQATRLQVLKLAVKKGLLSDTNGEIETALDLKTNALYDNFKKAFQSNSVETAVVYFTSLIRLDQGAKCQDFLNESLHKMFGDPSTCVNSETGVARISMLKLSLSKAAEIFNIYTYATPKASFKTIVEKSIFSSINHIINVSQIQNMTTFLSTVSVVCEAYKSSFLANLSPTAGIDYQALCRDSFLETFELHIDAYTEMELGEFKQFSNKLIHKCMQNEDEEERTVKAFFFRNIKPDPKPTNPAKDTFGKLRRSFNFYKPRIEPAENPIKNVEIDMEKILFSAQTLNLTLPSSEADSKREFLKYQINRIKLLLDMKLVEQIVKAAHSVIDRLEVLVSLSEGSRISESSLLQLEYIYVEVVKTLGIDHVQMGLKKALEILDSYDNKAESTSGGKGVIDTLTNFTVLVNNADAVQQMIDSIYSRCMLNNNRSYLSPGNKIRHDFEKQLDENVALGLNKGITVLVNKINYIYLTEQQESDFNDITEVIESTEIKPTETAQKVVNILKLHTGLLSATNHDMLVELYQQEIGTRFFGTVCKHISHQTISPGAGSQRLLQDVKLYTQFVGQHMTTKQKTALQYFEALQELVKIYGIPSDHVRDLVNRLAEQSREIFQRNELVDFLKCRSDWGRIRKDVEMELRKDGRDCFIM